LAIFAKNREKNRDREQLRLRKKRDFVAEIHTPIFHRFDLTFVVLLCLENFREYFLFCILILFCEFVSLGVLGLLGLSGFICTTLCTLAFDSEILLDRLYQWM
jgi:hypothetical protein